MATSGLCPLRMPRGKEICYFYWFACLFVNLIDHTFIHGKDIKRSLAILLLCLAINVGEYIAVSIVNRTRASGGIELVGYLASPYHTAILHEDIPTQAIATLYTTAAVICQAEECEKILPPLLVVSAAEHGIPVMIPFRINFSHHLNTCLCSRYIVGFDVCVSRFAWHAVDIRQLAVGRFNNKSADLFINTITLVPSKIIESIYPAICLIEYEGISASIGRQVVYYRSIDGRILSQCKKLSRHTKQ